MRLILKIIYRFVRKCYWVTTDVLEFLFRIFIVARFLSFLYARIVYVDVRFVNVTHVFLFF